MLLDITIFTWIAALIALALLYLRYTRLAKREHDIDARHAEEEMREFEAFWQQLEKATCIKYKPLEAHKLYYVWRDYVPNEADKYNGHVDIEGEAS